MNLIFGILWLSFAIAVFAYGWVTGEQPLTLRGLNVSSGWIGLVLAGYNFARFYASRVNRAEQESMRVQHEERMRELRHRHRPVEYDPNFDFTDRPAPPSNG